MKRLFLPLLGLLVYANLALAADKLEIGAKVPDFTLTDAISGNKYTLSALKGKAKAVAVLWVATQCPISNDYNERMNALYDDYRGKGIVFLGINSNKTEPVDEIKSHAKQNGFKFPVLKDEGKVARAWYASRTPELFVTNASFQLKYHGAIDNNRDEAKVDRQKRYARLAFDALLAGRNPDPAETKFFGCTIKQ